MNSSPDFDIPLPSLPSEVVINAQKYFLDNRLTGQNVLDLGCATGRNTRYLASLGHKIVGVTLQLEEAAQAARYDLSEQSTYIVGDIRTPMFRTVFDAVLLNEVLHMMPKTDAKKAVTNARLLTRPNGINVVSGYLVSDGVKSPKHKDQCFQPNELFASYMNIGWEILQYGEVVMPVTNFAGKELISSQAAIIARKPK